MVDIDGTLTMETEGFGEIVYAQRSPRPKMIEYVNAMMEMGMQIVLWTSRYPEDEEVTKVWLKRHGVKYTKLILGKPQYDLFIDDKAMNTFDFLED